MWSEPGGPGRRNRLPPAALAAPPAPSSHLKPALGHSVHVPPHEAGGCGRGPALRRAECKGEGPGQARELRGWEAAAGGGRRRGEKTLDAGWASSTSRGAGGGGDLSSLSSSLSSASTSTQNKNTLHLPATPLLIGQRRPGPERRGEGGEERSAARDHPSPTPAQPTALGPGAAGARGGARPRSPPRPAGPPRAGGAGRCPCVGVSFCLGGAGRGCECARARGPGRARKAGQPPAAPEPPVPLPAAGMARASAHPALELSVWFLPRPLRLVASPPIACVATHVLPGHPAPFPSHSLSP